MHESILFVIARLNSVDLVNKKKKKMNQKSSVNHHRWSEYGGMVERRRARRTERIKHGAVSLVNIQYIYVNSDYVNDYFVQA